MKKSVKIFYEYKRSYDFAELNRKFVKRRSHKRLRKQDVLLTKNELKEVDGI